MIHTVLGHICFFNEICVKSVGKYLVWTCHKRLTRFWDGFGTKIPLLKNRPKSVRKVKMKTYPSENSVRKHCFFSSVLGVELYSCRMKNKKHQQCETKGEIVTLFGFGSRHLLVLCWCIIPSFLLCLLIHVVVMDYKIYILWAFRCRRNKSKHSWKENYILPRKPLVDRNVLKRRIEIEPTKSLSSSLNNPIGSTIYNWSKYLSIQLKKWFNN